MNLYEIPNRDRTIDSEAAFPAREATDAVSERLAARAEELAEVSLG